MAEKYSGDSFDDAQAPTHKNRHFSLASMIMGLIALLLLCIVSIFSVAIPIILTLVTLLVNILGPVLQMKFIEKHIETASKNLYVYLDKRSQHLANMFRELWKKRRTIWTTLSLLIILGLSLYICIPLVFPAHAKQTVAPQRPPSATATPTGIAQTVNDSYGLSYGLTVFDTERADGQLKAEAAQSLKENNINAAKGYWQLAIREDETDAEACIYQENQNVLDSSSNAYVTLVVFATLSGHDLNAINLGRSALQGAYVAQKEYNKQSAQLNEPLVRILIANVDDPSIYANDLAQQIINAYTNNTLSIIGVVGQLSNANTAVQELSKAKIPMISSTLLDATSTSDISYLLGVAPSIQREAEVAAKAATKISKNAVVLYDPDDDYSNSLAQAFESQFTRDGGNFIRNTYTTGQAAKTLPDRVSAAMGSVPTTGLIYLAGYPDDASFLVPFVSSRWPGVQVMGGDALYQYVHSHFSPEERATFNTLLFTSFAFHGEWNGYMAQEPTFFDDYAQDFDSLRQHAGNPYGYLLPDSDTILSYDATNLFLKTCSDVLTKEKKTLAPSTVWQALRNTSSFSGVSGQITFGNDGEPLNKAVLILRIEPTGTHLLEIQGSYP